MQNKSIIPIKFFNCVSTFIFKVYAFLGLSQLTKYVIVPIDKKYFLCALSSS